MTIPATPSSSHASTDDSLLLLTDDEVVAVSASVGCPWPSPTPTVDQSNLDDMLMAIGRGRRSLSVRGLLTATDGTIGNVADSVLEVLGATFTGGMQCAVYVADERLQPFDVGPTYYHYGDPAAPQWTTDVVLSNGVHRIAMVSRADCVEMIGALVESVHADGLVETAFAVAAPDPFLCVVRGDGVPGRAVLVRRHELRRLVLTGVPDGLLRIEQQDTVIDLGAALGWLDLT